MGIIGRIRDRFRKPKPTSTVTKVSAPAPTKINSVDFSGGGGYTTATTGGVTTVISGGSPSSGGSGGSGGVTTQQIESFEASRGKTIAPAPISQPAQQQTIQPGTTKLFGKTQANIPANYSDLQRKERQRILRDQGVGRAESYLYSRGLSIRGANTVSASGQPYSTIYLPGIASAGLLLAGDTITTGINKVGSVGPALGIGYGFRLPGSDIEVKGGQQIVSSAVTFGAFAPFMATTTETIQSVIPKTTTVKYTGTEQSVKGGGVVTKTKFTTSQGEYGYAVSGTQRAGSSEFFKTGTAGKVSSGTRYDFIRGRLVPGKTEIIKGASISYSTPTKINVPSKGVTQEFSGFKQANFGISTRGGGSPTQFTGIQSSFKQGGLKFNVGATTTPKGDVGSIGIIRSVTKPSSSGTAIFSGAGKSIGSGGSSLSGLSSQTAYQGLTSSQSTISSTLIKPATQSIAPKLIPMVGSAFSSFSPRQETVTETKVLPQVIVLPRQAPPKPLIIPRAGSGIGTTTTTIPGTTIIPRVDQPVIPVESNPTSPGLTTPGSPFNPTPRQPQFVPPMLPFGLRGFSSRKKGVGKVGAKPKYGYTPSFTALMGGIRGSERKGSLKGGKYSGFEFRPITGKFLGMTGFGGSSFINFGRKKKKRGDLF